MKDVLFSPKAFDELSYWIENDKRVALKIIALIADIRRNPFTGLGKPELLRGDFKGWWSRRITEEHRLVYIAEGDVVRILRCRFQYDK